MTCPTCKGDSGVALIAAERSRQVTEEGWTSEHDDGHGAAEELAWAAACYAAPADIRDTSGGRVFPWASDPDRSGKSRIRQLVIAGALVAAEIDRLLRAASASPEKEEEK